MPFQRCPSPPMTPALYERSKGAVQVIANDGRQISAGRAAMFVLQEIGYLTLLARLGSLPPFVWAVELSYTLVANNRPFFSRYLLHRVRATEEEKIAVGAKPAPHEIQPPD